MIATGASGEEGAPPAVPSGLLLGNLAWLRAAASVCEQAFPSASDGVGAAYDVWLRSNPQVKATLTLLDEEPRSPMQGETRQKYARSYAQAFRIFDEKRKYDPEDLANQCKTTVQELADGVYDLPKAAP
ncbi:hypothetical protein [Dongia sp.]|uniref:hypothetical protein n=1 Tax=Dongia sp. TaxID=1977262 RepID=UPI003751109E